MPTSSSNAAAARQRLYQHLPILDRSREFFDAGLSVLDYAAGEIFFTRGAPVRQLFFLLQGRVEERSLQRLPTGHMRPHLVRTVEPTPQRPLFVLGIYDYLEGQRHSTHAVAASPCQVLTIDTPTFEKLLYHRPELSAALAPLERHEYLRTIPLLGHLSDIEVYYLAEMMEARSVAAQTSIFDQPSDMLYILNQGQVAVTQTDGSVVRLANGAAFGWPSLDSSARAVNHCDLLQVQLSVLAGLIGQTEEERGERLRQEIYTTLRQLPLFADPAFTPQILQQLAGYIGHYHVPAHTVLAQQGQVSDSLWILPDTFRAKLHALDERGQSLITTVVQGPAAFGEAALIAQSSVDSTIEAEAGSRWLHLHRSDFQQFLDDTASQLRAKLRVSSNLQALLNTDTDSRYPWLQDGEIVIWPSHRHWLVLIGKTWLSLLLLSITLMSMMGLRIWPGSQPILSTGLMLLGTVGLGMFLWGFYDYWNDYVVVTNRRLIRQEHLFLQSLHLQETGLEQVRNVDISKTFAGQLLGYGLLKVQTAGTQGTISFDFVPDVEAVQRALIGQMSQRRHYREAASKLDIQKHLESRLGLRVYLPTRVYASAPEAPQWQAAPARWGEWLWQLRRPRRVPNAEQDQLVWRKHWAFLVGRLFWPGVWLTSLLFLLLGDLWLLPSSVSIFITLPTAFLIGFAALMVLGLILWRIADWHNDTYEVTRSEVADVEKKPLFFDEQRRTARLQDIDNIRSELPTTLHYLLNFGNVRLETAAVQGEFTFDSVPNPNGVAAEIRRRIEEARRRDEQERARSRARELADWFELYDRLKPTE